ncbi:MAG TPA: DNA repair protein RecO [Bacteroidota bacterium]|nr:DNA repair protein RecO [Bacteroidota bacterium]
MILNTEAIVIASQKYGDSSKIITFFTKDFGIIKAIAKGSLQIKSKFGSALEILSYDNINFYSKPEGHLQLLSDAEILRPFYNLSKSLEHITIGFALCETILKTLDEQYKNPIIFGYLVESLNCLNNLSLNPANILIKFLINLSYTLGFGINFDNNEIENEHSPSKFNKQKYLLNLEN